MGVEFREEPPPADPAGSVRVWWCPRNQRHVLRLLDTPLWVRLHWSEGRSRPCLGRDCPECRASRRPVWKAYAPAQLYARTKAGGADWQTVILELTEQCADVVRGRDARDLLLRVSRGPAKRSPVEAEVYVPRGPADLPPAESFDVRPTLFRLWGVREKPPAGDAGGDVIKFPGEETA